MHDVTTTVIMDMAWAHNISSNFSRFCDKILYNAIRTHFLFIMDMTACLDLSALSMEYGK